MAGNGNGRYTAEQIVDALVKAEGFITRAAKALGCSPRTVYRYAEKYATVAQAIETAREERIDWVESKLFEQIDNGHVTAMIFYLKCQAKDRGYVERYQQEISGPDGGPIETKDATDYRTAILGTLCRIAERTEAAPLAGQPDGSASQVSPP